MIWWLLGPFLICLVAGVPIAFALGIAVVVFVYQGGVLPASITIDTLYRSTESFPLMAIPFFVLAGELMNRTGITERLVDFARFFVGRFRGGMAQVTIASGFGFAGLSGSAVAETAALGKTLGHEMSKSGYDRHYVGALVANAGVMAPVVPPSVIMILYGAQMNVSVGAMFVAGIVPGLMIAGALMLLAYVIAVLRNHPTSSAAFSWRELLRVTQGASLAVIMPLIIVLGLRGGVFTPTEGGAIAATYALLVGGVIYRQLSFRGLLDSLARTGIMSAVIMLIVALSTPFAWVLAYFSIPQVVAEQMLALTDNSGLILLLIIASMILVGMFLEGAAIVLLLGPVFAPMAPLIGIDPVHFAITMVVAIAIGMATPPIGVNLFVMVSIMNLRMERLSLATLPFVAVLIVILLLVAYFPVFAMWLPGILR